MQLMCITSEAVKDKRKRVLYIRFAVLTNATPFYILCRQTEGEEKQQQSTWHFLSKSNLRTSLFFLISLNKKENWKTDEKKANFYPSTLCFLDT